MWDVAYRGIVRHLPFPTVLITWILMLTLGRQLMLHYLRMAGLIRCAVNSYLDVSNAGIESLKEHSWTPRQDDTLRASGLSK